jgi:hypothetical protein
MPKVFSFSDATRKPHTPHPTSCPDLYHRASELLWPVIQIMDPGPLLHSFRASSGMQHIGGPVEHVDTTNYFLFGVFLFLFFTHSLTLTLQGYEKFSTSANTSSRSYR